MFQTNISPEQISPDQFALTEGDYMLDLYREGTQIRDAEERAEYFTEVVELAGDLAVYETLAQKTNADIQAATALATEFRSKRAHKAAKDIEQLGFAKLAPKFTDQVTDETRTNEFIYAARGRRALHHHEDELEKSTESQGLQELYGFLADYYNTIRNSEGKHKLPEMATWAQSIIENLTFIGEKEYQEAVLGLAAYWKSYLDEDPSRQICALASISDSERYPGQRKSDSYLRDRILQTFTDEELAKYSGRIVDELEDVVAPKESVKIVLIDDWCISGRQLRSVYKELEKIDRFVELAKAEAVEVNLLVTSKGRIEKGLSVEQIDTEMPTVLPVYGYYLSRYAKDAQYEHKGHVTGIHSSVNYDFEHTINKGLIKTATQMNRLRRKQDRIAIANIVPPYRDVPPTIEITATQLRRIPEHSS